MALRGSMELTTTRLLTSSSVTTRAALENAASVALVSPMSLSQSKTMLLGMWSKSCGLYAATVSESRFDATRPLASTIAQPCPLIWHSNDHAAGALTSQHGAKTMAR